jgi:predicted phage terminase large subunit-like protein
VVNDVTDLIVFHNLHFLFLYFTTDPRQALVLSETIQENKNRRNAMDQSQNYNEALAQAQRLAKLRIAERCKTDLFYLCKYILGYDLMTEFTHGELCAYTQSLLPISAEEKKLIMEKAGKKVSTTTVEETEIYDEYDPTKKMLLLMMPRNTFKSSVVTIGFALQFILHEPNGRVLVDSETFSKAKAFLAEIKGHLEDSEKFRDVFYTIYGKYPDDDKKSTTTRWTDSQIDVSCRTKKRKEPTFSASGIDKSINGMHYDLIICDDLHSEKNVTNKEQIEQVIQHWKLSLSLLEPNKYMVVIGTRWHYKDMYQYLLDAERDRFNIMIRQAKSPEGVLFFPEILTEEFLDKQKRSQGSYMFSCQYMNDPVDDETATFKRSYFQYKNWEDVRGRPMNWYLAIDPSFDGPYSDYVGMVECAMDYQGELIVGDVYRLKLTYAQIIQLMFDLYQAKKYKTIVVETVATQKSLSYMLNEEQRRRQVWLPVKELASRHNAKEERIRGLAPYYEFRRVWHLRDGKMIEELEDELLHFPVGKHDDVIDALSTVLEIATVPRATVTEDRKEKKTKLINIMNKPRSPLTGV